VIQPNVYSAIARVSAMLARDGVGKTRKNTAQGYAFRGIDEVYNALAPILAAEQLVILPRMISRICTERESKGGGALFNVVVEAEFDLVSAVDGSKHIVRTFGEAMDSADKATNKAMSAAYKYAAFQTFCIPTEGDNDADATTHTVTARTPPVARPSVTPIEQYRQPKTPTARNDAPPDAWQILTFAAVLGEAQLREVWQQLGEADRKAITAGRSDEWTALKAKAATVGK